MFGTDFTIYVAAVNDDIHADRLHTPRQAADALRRLLAGAQLAVVECVFFSHGKRREIGHDDIRSGGKPAFASVRENGSEGGRSREQQLRLHEPQQREQVDRLLRRSCGSVAKGCVLLGDERADAAHRRAEGLDEFKVLSERFGRLERRADHKAAAGLKTDFLQIMQAAHTVFERHFRRMQLFIVRSVRCLMPQQIAVCAGGKHGLVIFPRKFTERKRYCTVREFSLDAAYRAAD